MSLIANIFLIKVIYMFKYEMNEHVAITDILDYRCEHIMILSNIVDICISEDQTILKPEDIVYINELLQNEIKLLREDLRFSDVI